jgi:transcriptional regulator with AAA-type ATPase domain/maltose-binding protein MalE
VRAQSFRWFASLRTFALALVLSVGVTAHLSAGADDPLVLWLLPTDAELFPSNGEYPTAEDQAQFFGDTASFFRARHGETLAPMLRVADIRNKTLQDLPFARQVLGQRLILRALSQFTREHGVDRPIVVRFFDWVEIFDVLENVPRGVRGDAPHIVVTPSTWVGYFADRGILRPIEAVDPSAYDESILGTARVRRRIPAWVWGDHIAGRVMRAFDVDRGWSDVFALPWFVDLRLFFYRKDLFGEVPPADREEFLATALQIANKSPAVTPFALGTEADWDLLHSFSLLLWGAGGDWLQNGEFLPAEPSRDVLRFLLELRQRGAASFRQILRTPLEQQFLDGTLASLVSGPWMLRRLVQTLGPKWYTRVGVALPPFNVKGRQPVTYLGGLHLGLTARGHADPIAQKVIDYLTKDAPLPNMDDMLAAVPASRRTLERLAQSFPAESGLPRLLRLAAERGRHYPVIPEWGSIVEAESTRLGLFQLFKHIREDEGELAARDLAALQRRFAWEIRILPRLGAASVAGVVLLGCSAFVWFARRQQKLRRELNIVTEKCAVADVELRKARGSLDALFQQPAASGPDVNEHLARLLDLQQHKTALEIDRKTILRSLGGSRGPIHAIPRAAPFIPRLSETLIAALACTSTTASASIESPQRGSLEDPIRPSGGPLDRIIGGGKAIRRLKTEIAQVASSRAKVLLTGEIGTGKDLVAQAIHELSRRGGPFVSIDCASIPADLLEAQLFGVGPNSGFQAMAPGGRPGYLEHANGGTAFLDEIGKMPLAQQAKLLRVMETGRVVRVMDRTGLGTPVDVRFVAAYSEDLRELANAGAFDRALLSRLEEVPVRVPPLRERREDIPELAAHFLALSNQEHGKAVSLLPDAFRKLEETDFYDNVRGLRHLVSRVVLTCEGAVSARDIDRLRSPSRDDTVDRERLASAVRGEGLRLFVACAGFIADNVQEFFPRGGIEPKIEPARVDAALATIRRDLARVAGFDRAEYELPDIPSAVVYRCRDEEDDLNVHFLYLLVMETLAARGYHTGVGGGLPRSVRSQIEYVRRSLFYSEPVGRKARNTTWKGVALRLIVADTCEANQRELVREAAAAV